MAAEEAKIPAFRTTITPAETQADETPAPPRPAPKTAEKEPAVSPSAWSTSVARQTESGAESGAETRTETETQAPAEAKREVASLEDQNSGGEERGRIGRFFNSIWDRDDGEDEAAAEPEGGQSGPPPADWTRATRVEEFNEPASPGAKRSYRVQLASSRSEKEARAHWGRLAAEYAAMLGGREPVIEKTDLGNLGTFYRLQIGPFAGKQEPLRLCNEFKRNGHDCFLVVR